MPTEYPNPLLVPVNKGSKASDGPPNPNFIPPAPEFRQVPFGEYAESPWVTDAEPGEFTPPSSDLPPNNLLGPPTPEIRQVPGFDDHQFAAQSMDEFDNILSLVSPETTPPSASPEPYVNVNPAFQTPISERPRDRSWMFQQRPGWDSATTGWRNYTPAPVSFNNTTSSDWGSTALDRRPGNNGPADSTVRFYQRALDRAQAGSRSDVRRVNRLPLRINARPTNQDNG